MFSPTLPPFTHMYSEEPSLRRLKRTHEETGQRRLAPSPPCIIPYFLHPWFNQGVDRWQLLANHTSKSLCEPDMRISMFNCDVSQTLSAINSAADSIKIISTDLWVFLMLVVFHIYLNYFYVTCFTLFEA
jgi:hypothetical protein